ncbi:MAG: phage holin family protein [Clostridia bacterium]|nr:phage holin family protein [Clostridia bacterium]
MNKNIDLLRLKQNSIKLLTAISVFTITVMFTPNFDISSFPLLIVASLFIISADYLMSVISGIHDMPVGRGIIGFTSATVFIYMAQFFIAGYSISLSSTFIAALIYAFISYLIPNKV